MKSAILAGETYATVGKRFGYDGRQVHRLLMKDPDIVAAKAAGELRPRQAKRTAEDWLANPAIADVILDGMSVNAAAKKHNTPQPSLWLKVKKAKELMGVDQTDTDAELDKLVETLRKAAKRLGMRPEDLACSVLQRLLE